jgi:hypothetical protein
MFHIVDDNEWIDTIQQTYDHLYANGFFIVGGHFGILNNLKVGITNDKVYKKIRSKLYWYKTLKNIGFSSIKVYQNNSYLHINDTLPENNILIEPVRELI